MINKIYILFLLQLCVAVSMVTAQPIAVKGIVFSAEGNTPVEGASVSVNNTNIGTLTNRNGEFELNVPQRSDSLTVSYLGFRKVRAGVKPNLKIALENESHAIDEVVVVAYGQQKKNNLTSSVSSVKGEDLAQSPVASLEQALQGKASGVQVTSATGAPGGAIIVNVRGIGSITAGTDPLYVVDGIPIVSKDITYKGGYQGDGISGVVDINPADIEDIQVLKDASSASLYGSRASNGVILITTKRGKTEKTKITFDAYYGVQNIAKKLTFLDANKYVAARNEAIDNYNSSLGLTSASGAFVKPYTALVSGANTDWFEAITQDGIQSNYQLGISGGNDKTKFYLSGGIYKQEGLQKGTDYDRYNLRSNIDHQLSRRIKLSTNVALSVSSNNRSTGDNNIYSPWIDAYTNTPDQPVYNADGSYFSTNSYNSVQLINEVTQTSKKYRALVGIKADWNIWDNITYHANLSGDYSFLNEIGNYPSTSVQGATAKGENQDYRSFVQNHLIEHTVDYHKSIDALNLSALLGYSYQKETYQGNYVIGDTYVSPSLKYINSAGIITSGSSFLNEYAILSFFGRLNLDFKDRYLIEASLRRDASSKFASDKRVGYFPSVSGGWKVSKESFFPQNKIVSDLKIRASVGSTGNQENIGYYDYLNTYSTSSIAYNGSSGLSFTSSKANADLTWEKTVQYGVGLDVSLLNKRVDVTFDWYKKDTKDLLQSHSINSLSGYSTITSNVGNITNSGIEFLITSHNIKKAFGWTSTLNFAYQKNKVTALNKTADGIEQGVDVGYVNRLQVGQSYAAFYLIKALGIYQSKEEILAQPNGQVLWNKGLRPGDVKYQDLNGDGSYDSNDRVFSGSPFPKFFGSFGNTFTYKGFDLNVNLQYSYGNKIYAYWKQGSSGVANLGGYSSQILESEWNNRWTESNQSNSVPRAVSAGAAFTNNTLSSTTRYLEDGSFLRIKTVSLGYELPKSLSRKLSIERLRIYLSVNNLYTFTKYDGWDPEVAAFPSYATYRGTDLGSVPQPRLFLFGVNLTL